MTQHPPHPQRCETCKHCVDSVRRPGYKKCKISNYLLNNNVDLIDHISKVGCASHTTPASHQRIEQVINMLEKWKHGQMVDLTDGSWYAEVGVEKLDEAIALLRKGESP